MSFLTGRYRSECANPLTLSALFTTLTQNYSALSQIVDCEACLHRPLDYNLKLNVSKTNDSRFSKHGHPL